MRAKKYQKRMKQHEESFDKLWRKIVDETNEHIRWCKENNETPNVPERFADYMATSAAWLYDRPSGKMPKDRGSMTKKIRKALGYTIP